MLDILGNHKGLCNRQGISIYALPRQGLQALAQTVWCDYKL